VPFVGNQQGGCNILGCIILGCIILGRCIILGGCIIMFLVMFRPACALELEQHYRLEQHNLLFLLLWHRLRCSA
jgi:hypothetical protein